MTHSYMTHSYIHLTWFLRTCVIWLIHTFTWRDWSIHVCPESFIYLHDVTFLCTCDKTHTHPLACVRAHEHITPTWRDLSNVTYLCTCALSHSYICMTWLFFDFSPERKVMKKSNTSRTHVIWLMSLFFKSDQKKCYESYARDMTHVMCLQKSLSHLYIDIT